MKKKINILSIFSIVIIVFVLSQDIINYFFSDSNVLKIELTEEDSEQDVVEKEIKFVFVYSKTDAISNSLSTQLKSNIRFLNSFYKNPYIQTDTKPPLIS